MVPKRKAQILEGISPKIAARDILDQALRPAEYVVHSRAIRFPFGADQPGRSALTKQRCRESQAKQLRLIGRQASPMSVSDSRQMRRKNDTTRNRSTQPWTLTLASPLYRSMKRPKVPHLHKLHNLHKQRLAQVNVGLRVLQIRKDR